MGASTWTCISIYKRGYRGIEVEDGKKCGEVGGLIRLSSGAENPGRDPFRLYFLYTQPFIYRSPLLGEKTVSIRVSMRYISNKRTIHHLVNTQSSLLVHHIR